MMIVPVLITICHVLLNPKIGPKSAQTTMIVTANIKVTGLPAAYAVAFENLVKNEGFVLLIYAAYCLAQQIPKIQHGKLP